MIYSIVDGKPEQMIEICTNCNNAPQAPSWDQCFGCGKTALEAPRKLVSAKADSLYSNLVNNVPSNSCRECGVPIGSCNHSRPDSDESWQASEALLKRCEECGTKLNYDGSCPIMCVRSKFAVQSSNGQT